MLGLADELASAVCEDVEMSDTNWLVRRRRPDDDLAELVREVGSAAMESGEPLTEESLGAFLADDRNVYLTVHIDGMLAGTLHAMEQLHPSGRRELYVDEVDTDEAHRRRGVAAALMRAACEIARTAGIPSVWLCTEAANGAARALYDSLEPQEAVPTMTYAFILEAG